MAIRVVTGEHKAVYDEIEEHDIEFQAELTNNVVDYVIVKFGERQADITGLFVEPFIVDRFREFLDATQGQER